MQSAWRSLPPSSPARVLLSSAQQDGDNAEMGKERQRGGKQEQQRQGASTDLRLASPSSCPFTTTTRRGHLVPPNAHFAAASASLRHCIAQQDGHLAKAR